MIHLPWFNQTKLKLAFEYGVTIADVAKQNNVEVTPELIARAEEILIKEFSSKSASKVACEMIPNILATFETK